jgi:YbbR domain-containing protein
MKDIKEAGDHHMNHMNGQNMKDINISGGRETKQKKTKGDFLLKIISILTAAIIWFWVVGVESHVNQRNFTSVPVSLENLNDMRRSLGFSVLDYTEIYINVTLEGRNSDLNRLRSSDIKAYIDLSGVTHAGQQSLPIEINGIDYVSVVDQSQSSAIVYIDRETSVNIPVKVQIVDVITEAGLERGSPVFNPDIITVYGPEGVLGSIDHARVNISLGRISRTIDLIQQFVLIDNNGNEVENRFIRTGDINAVAVTVPVSAAKEVPLSVRYVHGFYNESNSEITITPETITIRGEPDVVNNISEIFIGLIDERQHENDTALTRQILLPAGVTAANGVNSAVIDIKLINMSARTISVSTRSNPNFVVSEPRDFEYHIVEESAQIRLIGPQSVLNHMTPSRISVALDLRSFTEAGTHTVPLDINILGSDRVFYVGGEYTVSVEIY